jgi:hypothetical protein
MKQLTAYALVLSCAFLFYGAGCEDKKEQGESGRDQPPAVLIKLYETYQFGQIEKCTYEGREVYHAGINAMDAGSQVYDSTGRSIGTCNYMARLVDPPCEKLSDCEVIYRCANHMSGQPAVDKFGLADSSGTR